jgi:hypothetical protein
VGGGGGEGNSSDVGDTDADNSNHAAHLGVSWALGLGSLLGAGFGLAF